MLSSTSEPEAGQLAVSVQGAVTVEAGASTGTTRIEATVKANDDGLEVWLALGRRVTSMAGGAETGRVSFRASRLGGRCNLALWSFAKICRRRRSRL